MAPLIKSQKTWAQNKRIWTSFLLNISSIILLFTFGIFIGIFLSNRDLVNSELLTRARSHFKNIVYTRKWNAKHGGVYVLKTEGMISNPYLENPDIHTVDGKVYTLKNPALMTREISEMAADSDDYHFHITSLKPLNPNNAADAFEKRALLEFEADKEKKETFGKQEENGNFFFRYMAPLHVEKACLKCHAKQGYIVGDIRGGISVTFNINDVEHSLASNTYNLVFFFVLTAITLLGMIYFFIIRLNNQLSKALSKVEEMAITDSLTGLYNRRFLMDKLEEEIKRSRRYSHALSILMIDIDFFKKVNDTYGHHAGDRILSDFASFLVENSRTTDTIGRYGGEEFIVILPETKPRAAVHFAENLRKMLTTKKFPIDNFIQLGITISIGVVGFSGEHAKEIRGVDSMINSADKALYIAKKNGRNRVEYLDFLSTEAK